MALFNVLFLSCRWGSKERVAKTQGSKSRLVCSIAKVFEMILTLFKLRTIKDKFPSRYQLTDLLDLLAMSRVFA